MDSPPPLTKITQYPPANETAANLFDERVTLHSQTLSDVAFGFVAMLFFLCLVELWPQRKTRPFNYTVMVVYVSLHFICCLLGIVGGSLWVEMVWIDNRGYPGGPFAFLRGQQAVWPNYMRNILAVVTSWLQDWLLVYRFYVIYGSKFYLLIVPGTLYLAAIALSCFVMNEIGNPGASLYRGSTFNPFGDFWLIEISTNIMLTALIVGKLMYMRHRLRRFFSARNSPYVTISAMMIESSLLYTLVGVWYIIAKYDGNSDYQDFPLALAAQVQSIAPLLVIWRVARGKALSKHTVLETETMMTRGSEAQSGTLGPIRFDGSRDIYSSTHGSGSAVARMHFGKDSHMDRSALRSDTLELTSVKERADDSLVTNAV